MSEGAAFASDNPDNIETRLTAVAADLERVSALKPAASSRHIAPSLLTENDVDRMIEDPRAGIDFAARDLHAYMVERGRLRLPPQDERLKPLVNKVFRLSPSDQYAYQLLQIVFAFAKEDIEETPDHRWLMMVFALVTAALVFLTGMGSVDRAVNAIVSGSIYWLLWEFVNRIRPVPNTVTRVVSRCLVVFVLQCAFGLGVLTIQGRL